MGTRQKPKKIPHWSIVLLLGAVLTVHAYPPQAPAGQRWVIDWSDEFTGTTLDQTKWGYHLGCSNRNNENQDFVREAVSVSSGALVIKSERMATPSGNCYYTSGEIKSIKQPLYGYIEGRLKLPGPKAGPGFWSDFWMWGNSWPPEIDIFEWISPEPTNIWQRSGYLNGGWRESHYYGSEDMGAAFHVYGLDWSTTNITWYVDNQRTNTHPVVNEKTPMGIIINTSLRNTDGWPGIPNSTTKWPGIFQCDYVRVYKLVPDDQAPLSYAGYPVGANISTTTFDLKVNYDEGAKVSWVVVARGSASPTSAQVVAGLNGLGAAALKSGNSTVVGNIDVFLAVSGLAVATAYDVYVVAGDNVPNLQASPVKLEVATLAADLTPPQMVSGYPSIIPNSIKTTVAQVKAAITKSGKIYYVLVPQNAAVPTSANVRAGQGSGGAAAAKSGSAFVVASAEAVFGLSGLTAFTGYSLYLIGEDYVPNITAVPAKISFTTWGANLASGKPVTVSAGSAVNGSITDGSLGSYFESSANPTYAILNMGAVQQVTRVLLKSNPSWGPKTFTFAIQGSTDGVTFSNIVAAAPYTSDMAMENTTSFTFTPVSVQYIKILFTGPGQICELEVYSDNGTPMSVAPTRIGSGVSPQSMNVQVRDNTLHFFGTQSANNGRTVSILVYDCRGKSVPVMATHTQGDAIVCRLSRPGAASLATGRYFYDLRIVDGSRETVRKGAFLVAR